MAIKLTKKQVAAELIQRKSAPKPEWYLPNFPHQNTFVQDTSRLRAILATRRSGKSMSCSLSAIKTAYENESCNVLIICLTKVSARRIYWKDCLKVLNKRFKLNAVFNETLMTMTLGNGSVIKLDGAGANESLMDSVALGSKYKAVFIDESASFKIDLRRLVYEVLQPATMETQGSITMVGTPSSFTGSLFFDVTTGRENGWSLHSWKATDNPFTRDEHLKDIETIKRDRPLFMETPSYKMMYLGLWCQDDEKTVYKYDKSRNDYSILPPGAYTYVLGVDLGHHPDPSAFVVCAYSDHDPTLYAVETFVMTKMDFTNVANKIKSLARKYGGFQTVVIDGSNAQGVAEMQRRHDLALTPAKKFGKAEHILLLNDDLIQARIKVHESDCTDLSVEWGALVWQEKGGKLVQPLKEHPGCDNHLSDAFLYAFFHCYQFLADVQLPKPELNSPEWFKAEAKRLEDEAIARYHNKNRSDWFDPTGMN